MERTAAGEWVPSARSSFAKSSAGTAAEQAPPQETTHLLPPAHAAVAQAMGKRPPPPPPPHWRRVLLVDTNLALASSALPSPHPHRGAPPAGTIGLRQKETTTRVTADRSNPRPSPKHASDNSTASSSSALGEGLNCVNFLASFADAGASPHSTASSTRRQGRPRGCAAPLSAFHSPCSDATAGSMFLPPSPTGAAAAAVDASPAYELVSTPTGVIRRRSVAAAPRSLGARMMRARKRMSECGSESGDSLSLRLSMSPADDALDGEAEGTICSPSKSSTALMRVARATREVLTHPQAAVFRASATTVQSFIRWRYSAVRVRNSLRAYRAARSIQCLYRRGRAREEVACRQRAQRAYDVKRVDDEDELGQSLVEGLYYPPLRRAVSATRVQSWWRRRATQAKYTSLRRMAIVVQKIYRTRRSVRRLRTTIVEWIQEQDAATTAQCAFRRVRAKHRATALRTAMNNNIAARTAYEAACDRGALLLQLCWRSRLARRRRQQLAAAAAADITARVEGDHGLYNMALVPTTRMFFALHHACLHMSARVCMNRRAAAQRAAVAERVARERRQDLAEVVIAQFARGVVARQAVARRAHLLLRIESVIKIQTCMRRAVTRRRFYDICGHRDHDEDRRVLAEQTQARIEDVALSVWVRRLQAAWRGKQCRRSLKYLQRVRMREKREWRERTLMADCDYAQKDATAAAMIIQRAWRCETAYWDSQLRRDAYIKQQITARSIERNHAARAIQHRYRDWHAWRVQWEPYVLRIQLWWRVQRRLRERRHQRCAQIVTRAFLRGYEKCRLRRLCNRIGVLWRMKVHRRRLQNRILAWRCNVMLISTVQAMRIQRCWRTSRVRGAEWSGRLGIANEAFVLCASVHRGVQQLNLRVPTAGSIPSALPALVSLTSRCLQGVADGWAAEAGVRATLERAARDALAAIRAKASKRRLRAARESHHLGVVAALRRCGGAACNGQDLDSVLWNLHRLPVGARSAPGVPATAVVVSPEAAAGASAGAPPPAMHLPSASPPLSTRSSQSSFAGLGATAGQRAGSARSSRFSRSHRSSAYHTAASHSSASPFDDVPLPPSRCASLGCSTNTSPVPPSGAPPKRPAPRTAHAAPVLPPPAVDFAFKVPHGP